MDGREWIEAYAARLGIEPPSEQEAKEVLALVGVAARDSERSAAPVAAWMAGQAGVTLDEARRLAKDIGDGG